jgi:hypothetical protein
MNTEFTSVSIGTQTIWTGHLTFKDGRRIRVQLHLHDDGAILGGIQTPGGDPNWKLFADIQGNINEPILGS